MILLCGKSASGKTRIQEELVKAGMDRIVTYTTRPIRSGEVDGISYHFLSEKEFFKKNNAGFFAETTSYNVASGETWHYGSAVGDLNGEKVIIVNPYGLRQIKKIKPLTPVSFYIMADKNTIIDRTRKRGDNTDEALRRMIADDFDFSDICSHVDFALRNDGRLSPQELAEMIMFLYSKTKGGVAT